MTTTLKTQNEDWGAWGTAQSNGLNQAIVWEGLSRYFIDAEKISPEETRLLLDSRFGRHMVDDLSCMRQPVSVVTIALHCKARFCQPNWRNWLASGRREALGVVS